MAKGAFPHVSTPIPGGPARIPGGPSKMPSFGDFSNSSSFQLRDSNSRFVKNGFGFVWTGLDSVFAMPSKFADNLTDEIKQNMEDIRQHMEQDAQAEAPWEDDTGDARAGLKAVLIVNEQAGTYTIFLGHSVAYGVFLEYANGGNFAIIEPIVQRYASQLLAPVTGGGFSVG